MPRVGPLLSRRFPETAAGQQPVAGMRRIALQARHLAENLLYQLVLPGRLIQKKYAAFQKLRHRDARALERISGLEEIQQRGLACDFEHIKAVCAEVETEVQGLVNCLQAFHPLRYALLQNYHRKYAFYARLALMEDIPDNRPPYVLSLDEAGSEELAGGKGTTLSFLTTSLQLPVPNGLVITTRAFGRFLGDNTLWTWLDERLARLGSRAEREYDQVSREIREAIMQAEMPDKVCTAVNNALQTQGLAHCPLAVRSSAVAEDLQASFAGQYESRLHVSPEDWIAAYKSVVASKYSPHALRYRIRHGFTDKQTPMAVVIMPMLSPEISGIMYTRQTDGQLGLDMFMVRGEGEELAAGGSTQGWAKATFSADGWDLEQGGEVTADPDCLKALCSTAQLLDQAFQTALDVEWSLDRDGRLSLLQARPLRLYTPEPEKIPDQESAQVLFRGQWVSSGRGSGPVWTYAPRQPLDDIPSGSILVVKDLHPALSMTLDRIQGVVAEQGSPACHFGSVAREAGIPVVCNVSNLHILHNGRVVSVDGNAGCVLDGQVVTSSKPLQAGTGSSKVRQGLDKALSFIAPLHLRDPNAPEFRIQSCRSLHDIVRFGHEAGVREMFSLVGKRGLNRFGAKRLTSELPLVMHVLDVGGGLAPGVKRKNIAGLEDIQSGPMQALWAGLSSPAVEWNQDIVHYDWDAYAKSGSNLVQVEKSTLFSSYAIVAADYVHALLRFGYHFAVVDSMVSQTSAHNYLHFSFKGGGGNERQRMDRVQIVAQVLEHFHFSVQVTADMLEAAYDRHPAPAITENLRRLGIVLGKTVLLDMRLSPENQGRDLVASLYTAAAS